MVQITWKLDTPPKITGNFSTLPLKAGGLLKTMQYEAYELTKKDLFANVELNRTQSWATYSSRFTLAVSGFIPLLKIRIETLLNEKQIQLIKKFPNHEKSFDIHSSNRYDNALVASNSLEFGVNNNSKAFEISDCTEIADYAVALNSSESKDGWTKHSGYDSEFKFLGLAEEGYIDYLWGIKKIATLFVIDLNQKDQRTIDSLNKELETKLLEKLFEYEMFCNVSFYRTTNILSNGNVNVRDNYQQFSG